MSVAAESNMQDAIVKQFNGESGQGSNSQPQTHHKESSDALYDFEDGFEKRIVALSLKDPAFMRRTEGLIRPEYFESESRSTIVAIAQDYFATYRSVPSTVGVWKQLLRDNISSRRIRKDMIQPVYEELKALIKSNVADSAYVVDKVSEFAKHQAVQQSILKGLDLIEKGRMDEATSLMEKAFRTGAADDLVEIDYWNDIERRTEYRRDLASGKIKPNGISTGVKQLDDNLFHGGWGRKELSILMGGAKKGKSIGLGEFSVRGSLLGYNVLHVTLEVSGDIMATRMDANVSSTAMQDLKTNLRAVESEIKLKGGNPRRGELRLVEAASNSLSPSGLRRIIERYKSDGIKFDLIVIDYLDIMIPDHRSQDTIENSRQIWLDARAIAFEEDAAVLSATQTNRDGFKSSVARAEHASDDFNKIRTADLVITINRDDAETSRGEARLFFAASRNQRGEFTLNIRQALDKMKFIESVTSMSA